MIIPITFSNQKYQELLPRIQQTIPDYSEVSTIVTSDYLDI